MTTPTAQHTPEKWKYEETPSGAYDIYSSLDDGDDRVCELVDGLARARLIAAAPDLLAERDRLRATNARLIEALEDALLYAISYGPAPKDQAEHDEDETRRGVWRAALAAARGEK